ncbi:DUF559 domain-containing protein [Phycicoccus ginsengisoli]
MPDALPQVFTTAEAVAAGMSDKVLRGPQVQRVFRGVYVRRDVPLDTRVRTLAALRLAPEGSVAASATAAELLGGTVPQETRIHLRVPSGRLRVPGVAAQVRSRSRLRARVGGLPVTTAEDTFVDLAGELGLVDLVVLGDSLVARRRTTPEALVAAAGRVRGRHAALARRGAGLVRTGVDSPMESRLRMLLVLAGLPEPVVNHIEYDEWGAWVRRYDLSYPDLRLAVEYDGRQHAESQRQWERDVERREELEAEGWRIVVVLAKGVYREPERTLERVAVALSERGRPARVTSQEWRLHFPSRTTPGS